MAKFTLPNYVARLFWSADLDHLDFEKHKVYIIHQVLSYGDIKAIRWLIKQYGINQVKSVFFNRPQRIYSKKTFAFISRYVLQLSNFPKINKYVSLSS